MGVDTGNWFSNQKEVAQKIANLDVSGDLTGGVTNVKTTYAAGASLADADFPTQLIDLDGAASGVALSGWTPTIGKTYTIYHSDSTLNASITLSTGITWDGTNDVATFADAGDSLIVTCVSATRLLVVENLGAVVFS